MKDIRFRVLEGYTRLAFGPRHIVASDRNVARRHHDRLRAELRSWYVGKPIHVPSGNGTCIDVTPLGNLELQMWDGDVNHVVGIANASIIPDDLVELALDDPPPGVGI